ncbi:MAG: hypothetical protein JXB32_01525 [Deltaproteobacteria bacterium]|nr:hypothetical protein [Deltaproteobacteria bacterium]
MIRRSGWLPLLVALGCGRASPAPAVDATGRADPTETATPDTDRHVPSMPDAAANDGAMDAPAEEAADVTDEAAADVVMEATDAGAAVEDASSVLPALRDDAAEPGWRWDRKARRVIDRDTLPAAFRRAGYDLPAGAAVYAVRIVPGVEGPAYVLYQAGLGAFSRDFWPASTVKLLAALAALEYVRELGFTGAARVTFDPETADSLRAIVDRSIRVSSNSDYDLTLLLAGVDRLNREFLTAARGFPTTVLQRSYMGLGVPDSPECTLEHGGRSVVVPARRARDDYGCLDGGNCASLFELTEALRRLVLHDELPAAERFDLDDGDRTALLDALCVADSSPFLDGAVRVLGTPPRICHKTGSVGGRDFLDHALLEDPASGERWLLAASVPDQGGGTKSKAALGDLAERVLRALRGRRGGFALQPDAGIPLVVQLDRTGRGRRASVTLTVDAPGADAVELFLDGRPFGDAVPEDGRFVLRPARTPRDDHLLTVVAARAGAPIGHRSSRLSVGGAPAPGRRCSAAERSPTSP